MKSKKTLLSKSSIKLGLQCPKALWLKMNKPDLAGETDAATQKRFDEGNAVGEAARKVFPKGVLIEKEYFQIAEGIVETEELIASGHKVLMEASFSANDLYARADIFKKGKKNWELIEVKAGTSVKPEYLEDVAIQASIIEAAGKSLESISVMHINRACIYPDLSNLFTRVDVTDDANALSRELKNKINELKKVAIQKNEPRIKVGEQCDDPYECAFKDHCWKGAQADERVGTKAKAKADGELIQEALADWQYPLYFFDFETIAPAIPRFHGTRPYDGIPFQFSCHVQKKQDSSAIEHFEYLHQDASDPRPKLIKEMLKGLGTKGSIVSYFKSFEIRVIKELAAFDKKNSAKLLAIVDRFVDPLPLIKKAVEHPDFIYGHSLKVVAPALIGKKYSYEGMNIGDGSTSQALAEQVMNGKIKGKARVKVVKDLLDYCRQDTLAMVELVKWLWGRVE